MINIRMEKIGEDKVWFIFDDGFRIAKSTSISGCAIACCSDESNKIEKAYVVSKRFRESIRDWLYTRYGNDFMAKERIFMPLFRLADARR